jgi:hypothetical protein
MAKVRVPRTGVTEAEVSAVLSRRLGAQFQVGGAAPGEVVARRSSLTAAVVRITRIPGATVFRVHGVGLPLASLGTARIVADALRRSPEFRSVLAALAAQWSRLGR